MNWLGLLILWVMTMVVIIAIWILAADYFKNHPR